MAIHPKIRDSRVVRLLSVVFIAIVGLGEVACTKQAIPPLPKIVTSGLPEQAHAQIDAAVVDAGSHADDAAATGRLGMVLHAYQQLEQAELCYRRAHLMDPKAFEWPYYLTVVEQIRGEESSAIDDARAAVKIDPDSRPARMRLADALLKGRNFKESREIYEKLVKEEPDLAMYHYGLGKVLAAQGGSTLEAIPQLRRACELSPNFSAARHALAMAYRDVQDMQNAGVELTTYQKNPKSAPPEDPPMAQITSLNRGGLIRAQAAQQYLALGRPADAVKQLESAVANDPNDEVAHSSLVTAYWELKQWDKAEPHYRIAAKLNPSTNSHYVYGLIMLEQSRYTEAAQAFQKALELNPRDSGANIQLGRILEQRGEVPGAIKLYETALESDPNSRAANYALGTALPQTGPDPDRNRSSAEDAPTRRSKDPGIHVAAGNRLPKSGR